MRFFLQGRTKRVFFDFIQAELESSLEKLNKRNEEDWQHYLEVDTQGRNIIGPTFQRFKDQVMQLKNTLERHFSRHIAIIEEGLVKIEEDSRLEQEEQSDKFGLAPTWICPTCTNRNKREQLKCMQC